MASLTFKLESDVNVEITITEMGDGTLKFDITVLDETGQIGDLRGIFFDLADDSITTTGLHMTGADITDEVYKVDGVSNTGSGNNVNGDIVNEYGKFDVGGEIGTQGMAENDIQSTSFILSHDTEMLSLADIELQDFAVRLTSVGDPDGARTGSLKIGGESPEATPENIAIYDEITVYESETAGDSEMLDSGDDSVLDNDTTDGAAYTGLVTAVNGDAANIGQMVIGDNGGLLQINGDGTVDFDANGEFDYLATGETAVTSFTYMIEGDKTATVTVTVLGENEYTAVADSMTVMASEGAGDADLLDTGDDSVLDNDLEDGAAYTGNVLEVNADGLNIGQMVGGSNGGLLQVNSDGTLDFDANGEFSYLLDGQTAQTQFTYTIEDGKTASVTVTVLGETVRAANDDVMTVMESETFGDADLLDTGDDSVLDNDTQNGGAYTDVVGAVNGSLGNVNSFVAGSMGGLLKIMADGSLDFDANGEFDGLASGETAQTTFTYELISGETATVTVNVLGESNYVANDDVLTVMESETSGDTETLDSGAATILANDTTDGAAYGGAVEQVGGVAGDVGQVVVGSNGGLATIYADGTIDFDANDEFDFLNDGESAQTTFTYGIQGGDTATVTVNILGENDTTGPMPTINLALMMSSVITMFEQADTGLYGLPPYGDWNGNGVTGEVIDMAYLMLEDFMTDAFTLANNAGYNLNVSLISFDETAVGEGAQFYTVPDQGSFHGLLDTKVANDNSGDYGAGFDNANAWFDTVASVGDINAAFVIGNGFGTDPYVTEHANLLTDHGVIMDSFLPDVVFSGTAYTGMGAIDKDGVTDLVFHNDPASEALYGGPAGVNALSLDHLIA